MGMVPLKTFDKMVNYEHLKVCYYQPKLKHFKDNISTTTKFIRQMCMLVWKMKTFTFYTGVWVASPEKPIVFKKSNKIEAFEIF